jgi:Na+/phosphate symporter
MLPRGCWGNLKSTLVRGKIMKKAIASAALLLSFVGGAAFADRVRDWRDLEEVHKHVQEAIHEMERARAANHYDMAGHGVKAEEHLRQAERELHEAVESAKAAR